MSEKKLRQEFIFEGGKKKEKEKAIWTSCFYILGIFPFSALQYQKKKKKKITCAFSRGNWRIEQKQRARGIEVLSRGNTERE